MAKPHSKSGSARAASPLAGAAVTVIAGDGRRVGSTTTGADGKYTLRVPGNATYVVKVTNGIIVMKAVRTVGTADATIDVNPGTTVTVAVLENALHTVLDDGTTFSTALTGVDVNDSITQITTLPGYTTAANAAVTAVAANTDPATAANTVTASTITHVAVPAAPTGVSALAGNGQVTLSWTAVAGADSYNIYVRTSAGVTVANGTKVISALAGGTITGLTNGTAYYFIVTAVNAGGESVASSQVSATPLVPATAPSAPTGVMATAGNAQATVSWTAVTGATSYNIYYRATAGVTIANGTKLAGATSGSTITGLTNGTPYYFVVTAVNAGGESVASSQVSATPQATTFSLSGTVTLSGTALAGVTMTLGGTSSSATTTSNSSGSYSFISLANGSYTITPSLSGYTFSPVSSSQTLSGANITAVNFTATPVVFSLSGAVTSSGAALAGVTMTLGGASSATITTDASGNYMFGGLANGSYTVTPAKTGYTFTPASSSQTISGANITAVNFTATPVAPPAGLVGYWKMDEASGSTIVVDSSGNNNNGILLGLPAFVTGKYGNAISFDGVNDSISMPTVISGPGWTINAWIKLNTATDFARVYRFGVQSGCNPSSLWFVVSNSGFDLGIGCAYPNNLHPAINLQLGTWYMVTAVWDTNNLASLYLNGQLVGGPSNVTSGLSVSYGSQEVGSEWSGGTHYFNLSQIDELRIYNRALSASEVSNLYNLIP